MEASLSFGYIERLVWIHCFYLCTPLCSGVLEIHWVLQVMFPSVCMLYCLSLHRFTICFGLHGHPQVCRIFYFHMREGFCFAASFLPFFTWSHSACFHPWGGLNMRCYYLLFMLFLVLLYVCFICLLVFFLCFHSLFFLFPCVCVCLLAAVQQDAKI
jgi:hypothetical protein